MKFVIALILSLLFLAGCQSESANFSPTIEIAPSKTPRPNVVPSATATPQLSSTIEPTATFASITPPSEPSLTPTPILAPGATQISPIDGMVLIYIPAGEFQMGSTEVDTGADVDEFPQHLVDLDAFWIDQTVVTNAMFARFLNEMGNQTEGRTTWLDAGDEDVLIYQSEGIWQPIQEYANHPAVEVTWYGARAYCQWAGHRLPTEAEWEKAARGDDGRIYPWGNEINCENAQYANCGGSLLPVDSKPAGASPYGVLGLSGNTWEWVADWYAANYYEISPIENPIGPAEGETRVLRGASWEYDWKHLRAANRRHNGPAVSMHDYGFRCVMDAP